MKPLGKHQLAALRLVSARASNPHGAWLNCFYHKVAARLVERGMLTESCWDYRTGPHGMEHVACRWKLTDEGRQAVEERRYTR